MFPGILAYPPFLTSPMSLAVLRGGGLPSIARPVAVLRGGRVLSRLIGSLSPDGWFSAGAVGTWRGQYIKDLDADPC